MHANEEHEKHRNRERLRKMVDALQEVPQEDHDGVLGKEVGDDEDQAGGPKGCRLAGMQVFALEESREVGNQAS